MAADVIRSIAFALLFYGGTVLFVLGTWGASLLRPAALAAGIERWSRFYRWLVSRVLAVRVEVRGQLPTGAVILASKHQSAFETLAAPFLFRQPAIVFKAELLRIPIWGGLVERSGMIPLDRTGSATALRAMLRRARVAAEAGRPIVIFPEGARVAVGDAPALKSGVAALYRTLHLPVVPIALDSGRLWPRRSFIKHRGLITLALGEPIAPGLDRRTFEKRLHEAINRDPASAPGPARDWTEFGTAQR